MRRVIILGGGYAGLHAFAALKRGLRGALARREVEVTLVSRDPHHTYHGWTGEVLSGRLSVDRTLTPIIPLLRDHFLQGEAMSMDPLCRELTVRTSLGELQTLGYEHLLIATGSRDPLERVTGMREHAWCLKKSSDMQRFVAHLERLDGRPEAIRNVVVVGAGFAGVETASALALRFRRTGRTQVNIHLVSSGPEILRSLRPGFGRIADSAAECLRSQGVEVHANHRVVACRGDGVELDDGEMSSDLTVVTAGLAFETLPGSQVLARTDNGQLKTEATLRVSGAVGVWAAGDIATVAHPGTGDACPANALWAMKQGECAGLNIAREILGRQPRNFAFKGMGQAAGLAWNAGITELYGVQIFGRAAWLVRILFFAWYMPSRWRGFSIVWDLLRQAPAFPSQGGREISTDRDYKPALSN